MYIRNLTTCPLGQHANEVPELPEATDTEAGAELPRRESRQRKKGGGRFTGRKARRDRQKTPPSGKRSQTMKKQLQKQKKRQE